MDLGKLNNDDSFVIGSNQALFVNHIVETVKEMLGKVQSSDVRKRPQKYRVILSLVDYVL